MNGDRCPYEEKNKLKRSYFISYCSLFLWPWEIYQESEFQCSKFPNKLIIEA